MKRIFAITVLCAAVAFVVHIQAKNVPGDVQQALISLDKQWGQAGGDTAQLNKIIGDNVLAVGPKGEAQGKQELIATNAATTAGVQNASYEADEYKFEMLSPDVVVMTHRGTTKGTQDGKDISESHRSLHVFQKQPGGWRVVANAQLPIQ
jgi:ketosteroid isomerase-like protein